MRLGKVFEGVLTFFFEPHILLLTLKQRHFAPFRFFLLRLEIVHIDMPALPHLNLVLAAPFKKMLLLLLNLRVYTGGVCEV